MQRYTMNFQPNLVEAQQATVAAVQTINKFYEIIQGSPPDDDDAIFAAIELAIGEACTNAVKHRHEFAGQITLTICLKGAILEVMVKDRNHIFDFINMEEPDLDVFPDSGYGIYIIKKAMDLVAYQHIDGCNIVLMQKMLPGIDRKVL